MEALSPWHLIIILGIVVLLFGGKKIPEMMRGLGEGMRSFKEGMSGQPPAQGTPPQQNPPPVTPATPVTSEKK